MNLGLKNYTKQLTHEIGVCSTHLNLNNEDNNLHISLPLISSIGPSPITLSLIYNYQDQQKDSFFGKGFTTAILHKSGNVLDSIDLLIMDVRAANDCGSVTLTMSLVMPSIPCAFVAIC